MWKLWAVAEGLAKTCSAIFQKFVGIAAMSIELSCVAALVIGAIQLGSGFLGHLIRVRRGRVALATLVPDIRTLVYAVLFGFTAGIFGTVLAIYTFALGADLGVRTLLMSASIIPGAILGRALFQDPLGAREWAGIAIFSLAMWAMLDFPDLCSLVRLEAWVWLTILISCTGLGGEVFSRFSSLRLGTWENNFWVGVSTVFFATIALVLMGTFTGALVLEITRAFLGGTVVIGFIVVAMISFKLLAYKGGGTIALKKIIMPGTYLVAATSAGVVLYGEPMTWGKIVGMALWPVSMLLADRKAAADAVRLLSR